MRDLKKIIDQAFVIMILGFTLVLLFAAPILHGFVDLCRALGAN